jgi:hypothetical protein
MKTEPVPKFLVISSLLFLLPFFDGAVETMPITRKPPFSAVETTYLADPCRTANTTFQVGEELTYNVYYNWNFIWLDAGEMTFRVIDEDDQYHFQVVGKTYESYDWFFKVRDYYDTWVQKDNLLPIMSIRNILEGKYTLYDYISFDQFRKTCYNERGRSKGKVKEWNTFHIDPCMHDMVSILYFARNIDFSKYCSGQSFPIKIFADKETWSLNVKYKGKETGKKVRGQGKFNTLIFTPEVIAGKVFPEGAELTVWVTDDPNRLPLLIESPLSVGSAKAVLKSYKGLRHRLTAKTGG